ncbi:MAG TPA: hypothetical protein VIM86_04035 [Thermodesulfobacteriota bacterium]
MAGLFGFWNWQTRQPGAGERTIAAWVILLAALASTAALILGVAGLMFTLFPAH